ncbi:MAG: M50 family metallopeptidase [Chloroflexi bacterium]|nr:M50 family metallopeptidase [Chloroflexota bacterium]
MSFHDPPPEPAAEPEGKPPTSNLRRLSLASTVIVAIVLAFMLKRDATSAALLFGGILIFLVVAHEFAHFVTAKLFGIKVLEFGVGFPPRMAGFRYGETEYTINWLPLGGFVRLLGEEDPDDPRSLAAAPRMHRFIVLVSGSLMNLALPVVLFAAAFSVPHDEPIGRAVIMTVIPGAPAEAAGFQIDDVIYEIDGREARSANDAGRLIRLNLGNEVDVRVRRGQEFVILTVEPRWSPPEGQGPTGITIRPQCTLVGGYGCVPFTERVADPPWVSIPRGFQATVDTMILARNEVLSWFRGGSSPEVTGPVGLAQTTGEVAREGGFTTVLQLAAILSINLGVLNLLPLPMLDGGRVMFLLIEVVRGGRRIAPEKEAMVHLVGFVLFIALAAIVTFFDITRIANGESIFR